MDIHKEKQKYSGVKDCLAEYIIEQSQEKIKYQFELIKHNESKTLGLLAISATIMAASLAVININMSNGITNSYLLQPSIGLACCMLLAMIFALLALWPIQPYTPGWQPDQFKQDIDKQKPLIELKEEIISAHNIRIIENRKLIKSRQTMSRISLSLISLSPLIGFGAKLLTEDNEILGTVCISLCIAVVLFIISHYILRDRE